MRIIPRIDIKNNFVIKGINLEGVRKIGIPNDIGIKYYKDKADELILMDSVASLYGRNNLFDIIKQCTKEIFIPITVGGGLRSIEDISMALSSGADKVALNSAAVKNPEFIKLASKTFGSSTIVISIETKKNSNNEWEVYTSTGRDPSGIILSEWVKKVQQSGCGEIFITSIDQEGTKKGFDLDLLDYLKSLKIGVPIIFCGGCGNLNHVIEIEKYLEQQDAIAIASALHYDLFKITEIKQNLK